MPSTSTTDPPAQIDRRSKQKFHSMPTSSDDDESDSPYSPQNEEVSQLHTYSPIFKPSCRNKNWRTLNLAGAPMVATRNIMDQKAAPRKRRILMRKVRYIFQINQRYPHMTFLRKFPNMACLKDIIFDFSLISKITHILIFRAPLGTYSGMQLRV